MGAHRIMKRNTFIKGIFVGVGTFLFGSTTKIKAKANVKDNLKVTSQITSHVGMVIHSTTLDTMNKVIQVYGGEKWIQHIDYMLRGAASDVSANNAQFDGGEDIHTLTVNEMPSHTHRQTDGYWNCDVIPIIGGRNNAISGPWDYANGRSIYDNTGATGGGAAHNNVPRYKSVYIWERTK